MNYYEVLGVKDTATTEEINKAFKKLALRLHPDKSSHANANQQFVQIREAQEVLTDPARRADYHRKTGRNRAQEKWKDREVGRRTDQRTDRWTPYKAYGQARPASPPPRTPPRPRPSPPFWEQPPHPPPPPRQSPPPISGYTPRQVPKSPRRYRFASTAQETEYLKIEVQHLSGLHKCVKAHLLEIDTLIPMREVEVKDAIKPYRIILRLMADRIDYWKSWLEHEGAALSEARQNSFQMSSRLSYIARMLKKLEAYLKCEGDSTDHEKFLMDGTINDMTRIAKLILGNGHI